MQFPFFNEEQKKNSFTDKVTKLNEIIKKQTLHILEHDHYSMIYEVVELLLLMMMMAFFITFHTFC